MGWGTGHDVTFIAGDAAGIPLEDEAADVVIPVFGVIFAHDVGAAAGEMSRVLAHDGRIVLRRMGFHRHAVRQEHARRRDCQATRRRSEGTRGIPLARRQDAGVTGRAAWAGCHRRRTEFGFHCVVGRDFMHESRLHPFAVAAADVMREHGKNAAWLNDKLLAIVDAGNEDSEAFQVTSPYVSATAQRPA